MAPKCNRVAVLGAGVGGLAAIKTCLEEEMEVVAFDSRPCIGGVWSGEKDGWNVTGPSMYKSLISNTSKSMTCYSDFPCPASYPPYLPHYLFKEYLLKYAQNFHLLEHIKFNTRVLKVSKTEDHASTGRWRLSLKTATQPVQGGGGESLVSKEWEEEFDGVIAATGFYSSARCPDLPGLRTTFTGSVSHACSYIDATPFKGKTVLVIGNASSAGDIAVEVSSVAEQVYLSVGDGMVVTQRLAGGTGTPSDLQLKRVIHALSPPDAALRIFSWMIHQRTNHRNLGLLYTGQGFPISSNDEIQVRIMCGKVKVLGHLREFKGADVTTRDGRTFEGIDAVIFATGYNRDLSVLDESLGLNQEKLELFKQVFPVQEKHHTLGLVGCIRVSGPMPPTIELQARLAAYTLSGRHKLPPGEVMKADSDRYNDMARQPDGSHKYQFLSIMVYEELAEEIGVAPHFWPLVFSGKPRLALKSLLGPAFPFNYRLIGPGAWEGAESAMDKAMEENRQALCNRTLPEEPQYRETLGVPQDLTVTRHYLMYHQCFISSAYYPPPLACICYRRYYSEDCVSLGHHTFLKCSA